MLEIAILGLLVEQDLHGYELKKRLADVLGPWSSVSFGSLYPALSRLERNGSVTTSAPAAATEPPMSGSLGAELAAFRNRTPRPPTSRRGRKVYAITPAGRSHLVDLLDDPSGDDRAFAIRVAFCRHLPESRRLELFERRRHDVAERLATRVDRSGSSDTYRRSVTDFHNDRLRRELAWLDDLIAEQAAHSEHSAPDPSPSRRTTP